MGSPVQCLVDGVGAVAVAAAVAVTARASARITSPPLPHRGVPVLHRRAADGPADARVVVDEGLGVEAVVPETIGVVHHLLGCRRRKALPLRRRAGRIPSPRTPHLCYYHCLGSYCPCPCPCPCPLVNVTRHVTFNVTFNVTFAARALVTSALPLLGRLAGALDSSQLMFPGIHGLCADHPVIQPAVRALHPAAQSAGLDPLPLLLVPPELRQPAERNVVIGQRARG